jgi:hypothetical protein
MHIIVNQGHPVFKEYKSLFFVRKNVVHGVFEDSKFFGSVIKYFKGFHKVAAHESETFSQKNAPLILLQCREFMQMAQQRRKHRFCQ